MVGDFEQRVPTDVGVHALFSTKCIRKSGLNGRISLCGLIFSTSTTTSALEARREETPARRKTAGLQPWPRLHEPRRQSLIWHPETKSLHSIPTFMHDLATILDYSLADTQHVDPPPSTSHSVSYCRDLDHRDLREDEFWRAIPGFTHVSAAEFQSHTFQARHSVTNVQQLRNGRRFGSRELFTRGGWIEARANGLADIALSPFAHRLEQPGGRPDPGSIHALASTQQPDHPCLRFDSLGEQGDSRCPALRIATGTRRSFCRSIPARSIAASAPAATRLAATRTWWIQPNLRPGWRAGNGRLLISNHGPSWRILSSAAAILTI